MTKATQGAPNIWEVRDLVTHAGSNSVRLDSGEWYPARPLGWQGLVLKHRLKAAWGVFTGKYDALRWKDQ